MTLDLFQPVSETQRDRVNAAMLEKPPHDPGVYTMYGRKDDVLYVGKAKDLFKRITSYRYSKSRKVQSMIAQVERIGFEICKTETDAILLENLLIRSLRPPFNHANKQPETYYYISTRRRGNKREFRLSMRIPEDYPKVYGCFKGHGKTRKGLGALLKMLYLSQNELINACYLPKQLLGRLTPMRYEIQIDSDFGVMVHQMLEGTSGLLISEFEDMVEASSFSDRFTYNYFQNELEQLKIFYALGPERNRQIVQEMNLDSSIIQQDQLDDFFVLTKKPG